MPANETSSIVGSCDRTSLFSLIVLQSIDSKREEFRKYLESAGVTDTLIRILTMLKESDDRVRDPLQYPFTLYKNSILFLT